MKKIISIIIGIFMAFGITACSGNAGSDNFPEPVKGVQKGTHFSSEYTGVKFTAPSDNWTFSSDEELALACNIDPSTFTENNFAELVENNATVYDLLAQSEKEKIAVLVGIENPKHSAVCSTSSAKEFVNNTIDRLLSTIDLESNTHQVSDAEKVTLCGQEYIRRTLTVTTETETAIQSYYARSMGNYLCIIVTAHTGDTTVEQAEKLFS